MQPRLLVILWVVVGLSMWGTTEVDAVPVRATCNTTVLNVTAICRIVVHHTGSLPRRYSTEAEKQQLKRQLCPCQDFEVKGFCPRFIYNLAKKYSPDIMCVGFRDPQHQP